MGERIGLPKFPKRIEQLEDRICERAVELIASFVDQSDRQHRRRRRTFKVGFSRKPGTMPTFETGSVNRVESLLPQPQRSVIPARRSSPWPARRDHDGLPIV
jgi:hypothetical protein